ncbi:hypothetical protein [[Clostridium] innocuum]|nr:hypothetical protein [[Clostridium] innocuum]
MKFYNIYEKEDVAALALYHLPFYCNKKTTCYTGGSKKLKL